MIHFEDAVGPSRQAFLGRCPKLALNAAPLGLDRMFLRSLAAFREDQTRLHHVNSDLGDAVPKLPLTPRASIRFSQADDGMAVGP